MKINEERAAILSNLETTVEGQKIVQLINPVNAVFVEVAKRWISIDKMFSNVELRSCGSQLIVLRTDEISLPVDTSRDANISYQIQLVCQLTSVYQIEKIVPYLASLSPTFASALHRAPQSKRNRKVSARLQSYADYFSQPEVRAVLGAAALDDGNNVLK